MKFHRSLCTVFALGLLAATPSLIAQADDAAPPQEQKGKGPRGGRMMAPEAYVEHLEKAVGTLSEEQKTKILAIVKESREKMKALAQEERREKAPELMKAQDTAIRALLTPEQQKKFDEMPRPMPRKKGA